MIATRVLQRVRAVFSRAMASTILNEAVTGGGDKKIPCGVRKRRGTRLGPYRAEQGQRCLRRDDRFEERTRLLQWWAD